MSAETSVVVNVNIPPQRGTLTIYPQIGNAMADVFTITLNGFTDTDLPLT